MRPSHCKGLDFSWRFPTHGYMLSLTSLCFDKSLYITSPCLRLVVRTPLMHTVDNYVVHYDHRLITHGYIQAMPIFPNRSKITAHIKPEECKTMFLTKVSKTYPGARLVIKKRSWDGADSWGHPPETSSSYDLPSPVVRHDKTPENKGENQRGGRFLRPHVKVQDLY